MICYDLFNPHFQGINVYIQVIYENKGDKDDILPHVVYVAREKRPNINHHYKAGAMNVMVILFLTDYHYPILLRISCISRLY
jgi:hypothetical protein